MFDRFPGSEFAEGVLLLHKRTQLANGITVVTEKIPHVRSVTIGCWIEAGSRYEDPSEAGISHFIEHLLFKGTKNRTARQIAEDIDAAGGHLNAFTGKELTCYYARVLDEHLALAVELLADMLLHSVFDPAEIEKEKGVVIEEIKMYEDTPDELVHDLFAAAVFGGHPLGRAVLGDAASVRRLTREQILAYMRRRYTAGNLVVAAAGNVEHERVVDEVERRFAEMQGPKPPRQHQAATWEPRHILRQKETEQAHLCVGTLGLERGHPDRFVAQVVDTALGGGMSSRLFQELREERGLVYSTFSAHASYRDNGTFSIYAGTSPENAEQVLEIIHSELQRLATEGLEEDELRRAKEYLKGSLMLSLESTANRMNRIAKAELYGEPLYSPDELVARIDAVTREATQQLCEALFSRVRPALAVIGPSVERLEAIPIG